MTVLNPNFNFPDKNQSKKQTQERRGGSVTVTNVKWAYDFRPIRNFIVILMILSAIIAGYFYSQKQNNNILIQADIEKEAEEVKRRYHERVLEKLKNDTIAAEALKMEKEKQLSRVKKEAEFRGQRVESQQ